MRRVASTSFFLAAFLLPTLGLALDNQHPAMLAQTDEAHPAQRTETKPFDSHAAHAPPPTGPWFDLSGLPPPRRADDLGSHRYAITVANEEARAFFDQGLIYAYGFNHLEALRAFRHAQTLDPECAMCFWGEAYVLGPNLNLPMEAGAAAMARTAAEKAVAKAAKTTPKEQALAAAILVRYAEPGKRAELDRKYAEAMQRVAQSFPDDPDIATLAAKSLMLLSPWDYWRDAGCTAKEHTPQALKLLEGALATHSDHIAAIHFYIHLVEASDRPQRAEPYADRLRGAVCFYGLPPANVANPADIGVPLQAHFANDDDWCTPAAVDDFEAALKRAGKPAEILRYAAKHGFMNEQQPDAHQRQVAELAWSRTLAFWAKHL